jgi:hypothetical protein
MAIRNKYGGRCRCGKGVAPGGGWVSGGKIVCNDHEPRAEARRRFDAAGGDFGEDDGGRDPWPGSDSDFDPDIGDR